MIRFLLFLLLAFSCSAARITVYNHTMWPLYAFWQVDSYAHMQMFYIPAGQSTVCEGMRNRDASWTATSRYSMGLWKGPGSWQTDGYPTLNWYAVSGYPGDPSLINDGDSVHIWPYHNGFGIFTTNDWQNLWATVTPSTSLPVASSGGSSGSSGGWSGPESGTDSSVLTYFFWGMGLPVPFIILYMLVRVFRYTSGPRSRSD